MTEFDAGRMRPRRSTRHGRLVQTYARDTGTIVTVLTVPLFVKQCRWGVVLLGWNLDGSR